LVDAVEGGQVFLKPYELKEGLAEAFPAAIGEIRADAQEDIRRPMSKEIEDLLDDVDTLKKKLASAEEREDKEHRRRKDAEAEVDKLQERINEWSTTGIDPCDLFNQPSPEPEEAPFTVVGPTRTSKRDRKAATAPYTVRSPKFMGDPTISETGKIPRPLGKTPVASTRAKEWYEVCPLDDERFVKLYNSAIAAPFGQRSRPQNAAFNRVKRKEEKDAKNSRAAAFVINPDTPEDIRPWLDNWARSPDGIPKPVVGMPDGSLSLSDVEVWMWTRVLRPEAHSGRFYELLWRIFEIPGKWEDLVKEVNWVNPQSVTLRQSAVGSYEWTNTPSAETEQIVAAWLGRHAGITPDRARLQIEPYAQRRMTGEPYSAACKIAQDRQQAMQARKEKEKEANPPVASSSAQAASSSATRPLAARITKPAALSARITDPGVMEFGDRPIDWSVDYGDEEMPPDGSPPREATASAAPSKAKATALRSASVRPPQKSTVGSSTMPVSQKGQRPRAATTTAAPTASNKMEVDSSGPSVPGSSADQGTDTSEIYTDDPPTSVI
jgi:hypothetical protein